MHRPDATTKHSSVILGQTWFTGWLWVHGLSGDVALRPFPESRDSNRANSQHVFRKATASTGNKGAVVLSSISVLKHLPDATKRDPGSRQDSSAVYYATTFTSTAAASRGTLMISGIKHLVGGSFLVQFVSIL